MRRLHSHRIPTTPPSSCSSSPTRCRCGVRCRRTARIGHERAAACSERNRPRGRFASLRLSVAVALFSRCRTPLGQCESVRDRSKQRWGTGGRLRAVQARDRRSQWSAVAAPSLALCGRHRQRRVPIGTSVAVCTLELQRAAVRMRAMEPRRRAHTRTDACSAAAAASIRSGRFGRSLPIAPSLPARTIALHSAA